MSLSIVEIAASSAADLLVGSLYKGIQNSLEEKELRSAFEEYSGKYFKEKYDLLQLKEEYDFCTLNEWLSRKLQRIIAIETEPLSIRTHYELGLIQEACAVSISEGDESAGIRKYHVNIYVNGVLHLVREFLVRKLSQNDKILNSLITDEIEKNVKKDVRELADYLLNELNYKDSFEEMIDSIEYFDVSAGGFSYRNKDIKLRGREKEMAALDRFLAADELVLFWAVTGPGGTGKSKFVFEYQRVKREDPNWKFCYLEGDAKHTDRLLDFKSWEYPSHLFIVIDYAGSCVESLYKWLLALQDTRKKKLRVLLIERQGIEFDQTGQNIEPDWLYRLHGSKSSYSDRASRILNRKYNDSVFLEFLELEQLSEHELFLMLDDYSRYIKKRVLSLEEKRSIIAFVRSIEFANNSEVENNNLASPLFVLFTADAALFGKSYRCWDLTSLVGYIIERNKDYWISSVCNRNMHLYSAIEKLMVLSTATSPWKRGTSVRNPLKEASLLINSLSNIEAARLFCGISGKDKYDEQLMPLEPDLVGELFVLKYFEEFRGTKFESDFFKLIWARGDRQSQFTLFLVRCIDDYGGRIDYGDSILYILTKLSQLSVEESNIYLSSSLFVDLTLKQEKSGILKTVLRLKEIAEQWPENKEVLINYASCLVNLSLKQNSNEIVETIQHVEELAAKLPNDEEISIVLAKGLVNMAGEQSDSEAFETINKLNKIAEHWSESEEMAIVFAKGLANLVNKQDIDAATDTVLRLEDLTKKWPNNNSLLKIYARGLANKILKQNGEGALETIQQLKTLTMQNQDDMDLIAIYAFALSFLTYKLNKNKALEILQDLETLAIQWPNYEKVIAKYCGGLVNLSAEQSVDEIMITVQRVGEFVDRWTGNEEIATNYARGLSRLSRTLSDGTTSDIIQKLEELASWWMNNSEIAAIYATELANLTLKQSETEANKTIQRLQNIVQQWSSDEYMIAVLVRSLFNLSCKQDADSMTKTIQRIEELIDLWPENQEMALDYSESLANLIFSCDTQKAYEVFQRLEAVVKAWSNNEEIAAVFAGGHVNYLYRQLPERASELIISLKQLTIEWPENKDILLKYIKGLSNLMYMQDSEELADTFLYLEQLVKRWPENNEIIKTIYNGLASLSNKQDATAAADTIHRIEKLADQTHDCDEFVDYYVWSIRNIIQNHADKDYRIIAGVFERAIIVLQRPQNKQEEAIDSIVSTMSSAAYDLYLSGKKEEAEALYSITLPISNRCVINLAYMRRREETKNITMTAQELLMLASDKKSSMFWCINYALCYFSKHTRKNDWRKAIDLVKQGYDDLDSAFKWWINESVVGKRESNIVILLLLISEKKIDDSVPISLRKKQARKDGYRIPRHI